MKSLLHIPVLNYVVIYFGIGFTWSAMQYVHHYGTERHDKPIVST
jgi:hypothetical protein